MKGEFVNQRNEKRVFEVYRPDNCSKFRSQNFNKYNKLLDLPNRTDRGMQRSNRPIAALVFYYMAISRNSVKYQVRE